MSTTTETTPRPPRAPAASVALTVLAVVCAFMLAPVSTAAAAEPLPAGVYELSIRAGEVAIVVDDDGVTLAATDGLVAALRFDELGRVLDELTVTTDTSSYRVEIEVGPDGTYVAVVEQLVGTDDTDHDEDAVVATVARCAPRGLVAQAMGLPNHGTIVSTAASGLPLEAEVTDPVTGATTPLRADFSSLAGAEEFCAQVDAVVPTLEEVRATLEAQAAAARAELASAQQDRAAAQEARQRAAAAERAAERIAERMREKAAGRAGEERRVPGRPDGAGATPVDTSDDEVDDQGSGEDVDPTSDDSGSTSDPDSTDDSGDDQTTDGGTQDGTSDTTDTTSDTDTTTTDDGGSTVPGQGAGKPESPGSNGKGPTG